MSEDELFEKLKQELREEKNKENIQDKPKKTKRKILTEEERQQRLENLKKGRETIKANREKKMLEKLNEKPAPENPAPENPAPEKPAQSSDDILNKLVSLLDSRLPHVKTKRQYKKREPKPKEFKPLHDNTIVRTREEEQEELEKEKEQEKPKLVEKIEPTPKMTPENKPVIKKGKLSAKDIYALAMSF